MGSHSKEYMAHDEAIRFIKNLERKLKRKARRLQSKKNLSYTDAVTLACGDFGVKNHYQFKTLCKTLRKRAEFFAHQDERIRCACQEKPENGMQYYIFSAVLDFDDLKFSPTEATLMPKRFKTLMSSWVGWADDERKVELRVADFVNPEKSIRKYRDSLNGTLYVINNETDLFLWLMAWGGIALVRSDLVVNHEYLARWLTSYRNESGWS